MNNKTDIEIAQDKTLSLGERTSAIQRIVDAGQYEHDETIYKMRFDESETEDFRFFAYFSAMRLAMLRPSVMVDLAGNVDIS